MGDAGKVTAFLAKVREGLDDLGYEEEAHRGAVMTSGLAARRLLAAVEAVLAHHSEFRIYDECDHEHSQEEVDAGTAVDCPGADFVTCRDGYAYSVCRACCTGGWSQMEECASDHDHGDCWPCPTCWAITTALLGEGSPGA